MTSIGPDSLPSTTRGCRLRPSRHRVASGRRCGRRRMPHARSTGRPGQRAVTTCVRGGICCPVVLRDTDAQVCRIGRVDPPVAQSFGQHEHRRRKAIAAQMGAFPGEFGILCSDCLASASSANRTALVVLAVCADGDEWIGRQLSVASVEREVQILARIAHLSGVQRFLTDAGMRHKPPPPRCGRSPTVLTYRRDAHLRRLDSPDDGAPELGIDDGRRLEKRRMAPCARQFEQHPGETGGCGAVHRIVASQRLVAARTPLRQRSSVDRHHDSLSQQSSDQHRRVGVVETGQATRVGDRDRGAVPGRRRHTTSGNVIILSGSRSTTRPPGDRRWR